MWIVIFTMLFLIWSILSFVLQISRITWEHKLATTPQSTSLYQLWIIYWDYRYEMFSQVLVLIYLTVWQYVLYCQTLIFCLLISLINPMSCSSFRSRSVTSSGTTREKMWLMCTGNTTSPKPLEFANKSSTHSQNTYRSVSVRVLCLCWMWALEYRSCLPNGFESSSWHHDCLLPGTLCWKPRKSGSQSSVGRCCGIPSCLC